MSGKKGDMDYDTDRYDEDEDDGYDYESYYDHTDGWPDYLPDYEPPSRRQLLIWQLQTLWYRVRHPLFTIRGWWHRTFSRCDQCGKLSRNCDCIPF